MCMCPVQSGRQSPVAPDVLCVPGVTDGRRNVDRQQDARQPTPSDLAKVQVRHLSGSFVATVLPDGGMAGTRAAHAALPWCTSAMKIGVFLAGLKDSDFDDGA